jgi:hypothetical protein
MGRSLRRITKRSPDHVSFTAQTLLSTSPAASPTSRTTFSVVRCDTRRLLRPDNPHTAGGLQGSRDSCETAFEIGPTPGEEQSHVDGPARAPCEAHTVRQWLEFRLEASGRVKKSDTCARFDAQLLRQWSPRVPGHELTLARR